MRPQPLRPSAAVRARCALGAAVLLAACAPDAGIVAPASSDGAASVEVVEYPSAECEEVRLSARAIREITTIDPLCVSPEAQPLIWREHFASRGPFECGCLDGDALDR